jgi:cytidylate kinase
VGLYAIEKKVDTKKSEDVELLLPEIKVELKFIDNSQRVILNGQDVSEKIRTPDISMAASNVSAIPSVRRFLLSLQKDIAKENNVIMDGRDIGTVVLPQANIKIFLTASPEDRSRRRYEELCGRGMHVKYEDVLSDVILRDKQDSERETAPLKPAADAIIIDTTGFELQQSLNKLYTIVKEKMNDGENNEVL